VYQKRYIFVSYNKRQENMNTTELKSQIEKTAKEAGSTEIEIISAMQAECSKQGNEEMIETLGNLKWDYINK
jgi:hypothetical protein